MKNIQSEIMDQLRIKIQVMKEMLEEFVAEKETANKEAREDAAAGKIPSMFGVDSCYASIRWATGKRDAYIAAMGIVIDAFENEAMREKNAERNRIMKESA